MNGVEVTVLNACQARNGIVHIMDSVIPQSNMSLAALVHADSRLSTFLRLLDVFNATTRFFEASNGKSITLLAPTNNAFDKLPEGALDYLEQPENIKSLLKLLISHSSVPAQYSAPLSRQSTFTTFNNTYHLLVQVEDGEVLLTSDRIPLEESDISASNGVIHVLPDVIIPPDVVINTQ